LFHYKISSAFDYIFASNEYQDDYPNIQTVCFLIKKMGLQGIIKTVLPDSYYHRFIKNMRPFINYTFIWRHNRMCRINEQYFGQSNAASTNSSPYQLCRADQVPAQTSVIQEVHIKLVPDAGQMVIRMYIMTLLFS
jgi:hypothetical protein